MLGSVLTWPAVSRLQAKHMQFWMEALRTAVANLKQFGAGSGGGGTQPRQADRNGVVQGTETAPTRTAALLDLLEALREVGATHFTLPLLAQTGVVTELRSLQSHQVSLPAASDPSAGGPLFSFLLCALILSAADTRVQWLTQMRRNVFPCLSNNQASASSHSDVFVEHVFDTTHRACRSAASPGWPAGFCSSCGVPWQATSQC